MYGGTNRRNNRTLASPARFRTQKSGNSAATTPLRALRMVENVTPRERELLEAAERGDKATVLHCLSTDPVNVNCKDLLGRTPIEIAVDNENLEIVQILLRQPNIRIGNALLYAIREGVYKLVEMLINHSSITPEMLGEGWATSLDKDEAAQAEYSSDISPIVLAAHLCQFEVLQLLLSRGATIQKPHSLSCSCKDCEKERLHDSLHHSLRRINTYKALASPAWISLTSSDPILTAFKLSWELERLSFKEHEFKDFYQELSQQCKSYACDLLSQCRSTDEVIAVLNKDSTASDVETTSYVPMKLSLARLKLAIKYEQKQFVSHPHCQQLLTSIWYEGFPGRQERGSWINIFVCILLILLWPILAVSYILMPHSRVGQIVRSPFMKFLYYSTSFGCFLALLTITTFESYRNEKGTRNPLRPTRAFERGPFPTVVETFILVWVLGMVWSEVKQLWEEGFIKYIKQWWNWLDFIMMSLYLCCFLLRAVAFYLVRTGDYGPAILARTEWVPVEPMLVSEGLFAVANIFSFARIIYLFQTNPYLGPLQISLGCMLVDVAKFCFIFFLVLSSFAIGLAQLYWYYDPTQVFCTNNGTLCQTNPSAFSSIANSYTTLMWSLFSITNTKDTEVREAHTFTQWVGRGTLIAYHMTSIIVLLNMLIAMMSHSFQIINDHADLEWKFHRTKLWMGHFDEGSSLPPPFNLIISPKTTIYFFRNIYHSVLWCVGKYQWRAMARSKRATIRRPGYNRAKNRRSVRSKEPKENSSMNDEPSPPQSTFIRERLSYQDIMRRLVARLIHQTKKDMKMDTVNEDDLLEIKQDISSLRYELRDDRQKDIIRSSTHIDSVKKDIMRSLSTTAIRTPANLIRPLPDDVLHESGEIPGDPDEDSSIVEESDIQSQDGRPDGQSGPPVVGWKPPVTRRDTWNTELSSSPIVHRSPAEQRCANCRTHGHLMRSEMMETLRMELHRQFLLLKEQLNESQTEGDETTPLYTSQLCTEC